MAPELQSLKESNEFLNLLLDNITLIHQVCSSRYITQRELRPSTFNTNGLPRLT